MKLMNTRSRRAWVYFWAVILLSSEVMPNFNIRKTDDELFDFKTHDMVPLQINENEIRADRLEIPQDEDETLYQYYINYIPEEDHYLVKKNLNNKKQLQTGDSILIVKAGEAQLLGVTDQLPVELDTSDVMSILAEDATNTANEERLAFLKLQKFSDQKRELEDLDAAYHSHFRVLDIIKYELSDDENFLKLGEDAEKLLDFDDMTKAYLEHLNEILTKTVVPNYDRIINDLISGKLGQNGHSLNGNGLFSGLGESNDSKFHGAVSKMVDEFKQTVTSNVFMMATIRRYYEVDVREFVNGGNVIQAILERIMSPQPNLLLSTLKKFCKEGRMSSLQWSLSPPTDKEQNVIHIQNEMKDYLAQVVGAFIAGKIDSSLEHDDLGNVVAKNLSEKAADNASPIEKFDLHLNHMMDHLNKKFFGMARLHWEFELSDLAFLNEKFMKEANFNQFVIDMILENSDETVKKFIDQYVSVTLTRTFVPDIFLGTATDKVNQEMFLNAMAYFDSSFNRATDNTGNVQIIHNGPALTNDEEQSQDSLSSEMDNSQSSSVKTRESQDDALRSSNSKLGSSKTNRSELSRISQTSGDSNSVDLSKSSSEIDELSTSRRSQKSRLSENSRGSQRSSLGDQSSRLKKETRSSRSDSDSRSNVSRRKEQRSKSVRGDLTSRSDQQSRSNKSRKKEALSGSSVIDRSQRSQSRDQTNSSQRKERSRNSDLRERSNLSTSSRQSRKSGLQKKSELSRPGSQSRKSNLGGESTKTGKKNSTTGSHRSDDSQTPLQNSKQRPQQESRNSQRSPSDLTDERRVSSRSDIEQVDKNVFIVNDLESNSKLSVHSLKSERAKKKGGKMDNQTRRLDDDLDLLIAPGQVGESNMHRPAKAIGVANAQKRPSRKRAILVM